MPSMPPTDLLAALEAATGPSRELDARILMLVTGGSEIDADYAASDPNRTCNPSRYTHSIDAALTLVPEDCHINFGMYPANCTYSFAKPWAQVWRAGVYGRNESAAATPALALCIASLKARIGV